MWNLKSHTTFKKKNALFLLPCQKWIWKKIFPNEIASDELSLKRLASFFTIEYVYKFLKSIYSGWEVQRDGYMNR